MKKILLLFLILTFIFPSTCLGAEESRGGIKVPTNFEEVASIFKEIGENIIFGIPRGIAKTWNKVTVPVFNFIQNRVWPKIKGFIKSVIEKIKDWFLSIVKPKAEKEIEERKPVIKEELEKEVEEIRRDKETLWEGFKNWFKDIWEEEEKKGA